MTGVRSTSVSDEKNCCKHNNFTVSSLKISDHSQMRRWSDRNYQARNGLHIPNQPASTSTCRFSLAVIHSSGCQATSDRSFDLSRNSLGWESLRNFSRYCFAHKNNQKLFIAMNLLAYGAGVCDVMNNLFSDRISKGEPTWLRPEKIKFEATNSICYINNVRPTTGSVQMAIFPHFRI